jgi:hypothetical protein
MSGLQSVVESFSIPSFLCDRPGEVRRHCPGDHFSLDCFVLLGLVVWRGFGFGVGLRYSQESSPEPIPRGLAGLERERDARPRLHDPPRDRLLRARA